jgi:hypothetical protein
MVMGLVSEVKLSPEQNLSQKNLCYSRKNVSTLCRIQCCIQQFADYSTVVTNMYRLLVHCVSVVNEAYLLSADFSAALKMYICCLQT